jgi:hypothetical protein
MEVDQADSSNYNQKGLINNGKHCFEKVQIPFRILILSGIVYKTSRPLTRMIFYKMSKDLKRKIKRLARGQIGIIGFVVLCISQYRILTTVPSNLH